MPRLVKTVIVLFVGRSLYTLSPVKVLSCSVIFFILATQSHAYQLPGDPDSYDNRFALSSLKLDLSDSPLESSITRKGEGAATLKYKLGGPKGFLISSSYSSRMEKPFDGSGELNTDGFWDLRLRTPRSGAMPAVKIDYSFGGFDGDSGDEFGDADHRMLKVKTDGKLGVFDHGFSYKSVGANYYAVGKKKKKNYDDKDKDKESIETWVGKSFGELSLSQFVKQIESDEGEKGESLVGARAEYTWYSWPYIGTSFSHATGNRYEDERYSDDDDFQVGITSLSAALSMSHDIWNADLYVDRTTVDEAADQSYGQPDLTTVYLGGSIYPNKTLSITPYVSFTEEDYREYAVETRTFSKALSLSYKPLQNNYTFSAYISSDTQENHDWGMDTSYFYSEAGIEWDLSDSGGVRKLLSFTVGYDRYEDHIYSGANMDDVSVKISFKSYSLDSILRAHNQFRDDRSRFSTGLFNAPGYSAGAIFP
jgi:hypothetical protein